jgi:hypothetical protein
MKLYIANAKLQTEAFTYRVPDGEAIRGSSASGARTQTIDSGRQVMISGDLNRYQIDAIIEQHRPYGLVDVADLDGVRGYAGLCFSIDKPVSPARLEQLMGNNIDHLEQRGREMREMAAVATNDSIEGTMSDSQMPGRLKNLEMEVVEERNVKSDGPEMTPQRIRVTRDAEPTKAPTRAARKAAPGRRRAG